MLDVESSMRGTAESYVAKVKVQHKQNPRLFDPRCLDSRSFGIQHFAGRVTYDTSDFLGEYLKFFIQTALVNIYVYIFSKINICICKL